MKLKLVRDGLSPGEMVTVLRKGHVVRRSAWVDDYYIRICNETKYDENGNCIFNPDASIYTVATNGYFYHLGTSSQPLRKAHVYLSGSGEWEHSSRSAEGLNGLFQDDWEDYGFMPKADFYKLEDEIKYQVRKNTSVSIILALLEKDLKPRTRTQLEKELKDLKSD